MSLYVYRARVVSVHDGDSLTVDTDLGMRVTVRTKLRLLGIDAPELGSPAGTAARDRLRELLPVGAAVIIATAKDPRDKYGRWLADVHTAAGGLSVNAQMVADGMAVAYAGGTR